MQPAAIRSLFLIDLLLLAYATDGAAKTDADVERHCPSVSGLAADAYTADGSHPLFLTANRLRFTMESPRVLKLAQGTTWEKWRTESYSTSAMKIPGKFATMGAVACFLLSTCTCSHDNEQGKKRLGAASEQFLAAQSLVLKDGKGELLGGIEVHSDGSVSVSLNTPIEVSNGYVSVKPDTTSGRLVASYDSGQSGSILTLYGPAPPGHFVGPHILVLMLSPASLPAFTLRMPDGREVNTNSKGWQSNSSSPISTLFKAGYRRLFPPKSEHTIDDQIPSEDVRFVGKEGQAILICGLSEKAEPSIAVFAPDGSLRALLRIVAIKLDNEKSRPSLNLFGAYGQLKFAVDAAENGDPVLTVFEETKSDSADIGLYTLDATNGQEIPVKPPFNGSAGRIPWLLPLPHVRLPIVLLDERNKILWKSGSS